jgi:hypothetical protein
MPGYLTEIEWEEIPVRIFYPEGARQSSRYKAWKKGHPALCAYGQNLAEAVTNLLNKFGE